MKADAHGTKLVVELTVPIGPEGNKLDKRIGTVNLGSLGKHIKRHRVSGKINHIYILGRAPAGFGNIEEVSED